MTLRIISTDDILFEGETSPEPPAASLCCLTMRRS